MHPNGDYYIADWGNNSIRKVSGGIITAFAGSSTAMGGFSGDGAAATDALLSNPSALVLDRSGTPTDFLKRSFRIATASGYIDSHPEMEQELLNYRLTNPVPPPQYQAQALASCAHNEEARMGEIKAPTLILFGAEDNVVNPDNAPLMQERIPNSAVVVLPGVGHMFTIENPKLAAQAIREFLG